MFSSDDSLGRNAGECRNPWSSCDQLLFRPALQPACKREREDMTGVFSKDTMIIATDYVYTSYSLGESNLILCLIFDNNYLCVTSEIGICHYFH